MNILRRISSTFTLLLILLALLAAVPALVLARGSSTDIPENARTKSYGSGWECDRGYHAVDKTCVAVKVPANGYFLGVSYGPGWKCDRGYREAGGACVAMVIPENAHLDYSGNGWECNRPYGKQQDKCVLR